MAYDKCNLERDGSIGASSIPARVNIGARVSLRGGPFRSADIHRRSGLSGCPFRLVFVRPTCTRFDLFGKLPGCKTISDAPGCESIFAERGIPVTLEITFNVSATVHGVT